ncbi:MAG: Smr/MutS family protein [Mariprofundaceae bacterium]|nr:Smr/MutS family protein [Mariprofundaceae bacterium]
MDDDELFSRAMGAVRPIAASDKITVEKPKPERTERTGRRNRLPEQLPAARHSAPESVEEPWTLVNSGISREKLKQLAAGKPAIGLEIDLHGMNRDEALSGLERLFAEALSGKTRVICIVHGRGLHSQGRPVLKEATYQWLRSGPFASSVLAAIPRPDTGGGSCLVLLRRVRSGRR